MDEMDRMDGSWNEYSDVSDEMRMLSTYGCNDDDYRDDDGDDVKNNDDDDDNVGNNGDDDDESG